MCDLLLPAQVSPTLCAPAARGEFGLPCGQPRSLTKYRCSCTNPSTAHGHLRGRKWGRGSTPQSWVRVNEWIKHLEQDLAHDKHETDVPCLWVLQGLSVVTELFLLLVRVFKTGPPLLSPRRPQEHREKEKDNGLVDWSMSSTASKFGWTQSRGRATRTWGGWGSFQCGCEPAPRAGRCAPCLPSCRPLRGGAVWSGSQGAGQPLRPARGHDRLHFPFSLTAQWAQVAVEGTASGFCGEYSLGQ